MGNPAPSRDAEIDLLRAAYAALNRGDADGFVAAFHPDVERAEFIGHPQGGTYHGLAAVRAHVEKGRGTWAEGACEPERFLTAGDRIAVVVRVRVRVKNEQEWREGKVADVFTFRGSRVVKFRSFADVAEGLASAGIDGAS